MIWFLILMIVASYFFTGSVRPGIAFAILVLFVSLLWRMAGALV